MPRRNRSYTRTPVTLVLPVNPLTQDESDAILMATGSIVGQAGWSGVVLILNGSHFKKGPQ